MNNGGGERAEQQFNLMLQRVFAQDVQVMDPELLEKVTGRQEEEGGRGCVRRSINSIDAHARGLSNQYVRVPT